VLGDARYEPKKNGIKQLDLTLKGVMNFGSESVEPLGPGAYSASNRNEYKKQKNNVAGE
jgi:hypothetical protein